MSASHARQFAALVRAFNPLFAKLRGRHGVGVLNGPGAVRG